MKAWHFVNSTMRDGRPVPENGVKLVHEGDLVMCKSGLHASKRLIDALRYAPGNMVCRVEVSGCINDADKMVCRKRTILWRVDAENLLRDFARRSALDVIHLWEAPEIAVRFLKTGDEDLRAAARDAAWDAAWAAARAAARAAATDAAWAAAKDAARDAAWAAARDAAKDATWAAARDTQNRRLTSMVMAAHRRETC